MELGFRITPPPIFPSEETERLPRTAIIHEHGAHTLSPELAAAIAAMEAMDIQRAEIEGVWWKIVNVWPYATDNHTGPAIDYLLEEVAAP